jgi:UDP-N-acetylglucosamine:LPS N-acetylglucosamine transferase
MFMFLQVVFIVLKFRPNTIVTTGAAPGVFAVRIGKMLGARTIWIDSIANSEELSLSGRLVRKHVDLWLTQWPHLVGAYPGLQYFGSVI